jgi:NRPS condensation-like uncharacterized protein
MAFNPKNNIELTGTDCFILALEKHDKNKDVIGNTCRYIIDLDGDLKKDKLKNELDLNKTINWLSKFYISETFFSKKWKVNEESSILINELVTEELLPSYILSNKLQKSLAPLLHFDILRRKNNTTRLIISWHHLLMDGYGAVLLIKSIANVIGEKNHKKEINLSFKKNFRKATKSKFFLKKSSNGEISDIVSPSSIKGEQKLKTITFSTHESERIKANALSSGATFGLSPFYISCISLALKNRLLEKGHKNINFWIPVPQDSRKKGANSPIIGNHLTFLFYRIFDKDLFSISSIVKTINFQMVDQLKKDLPNSYLHLMSYLKRIPSPIYYYLIKGKSLVPRKKSLSSFLFTIAADHPKDFNKMFGFRIINAISLPPNTYPPGITFAFTSFEQKVQLAIMYYDNVFNAKEIDQLEKDIKKYLVEKS